MFKEAGKLDLIPMEHKYLKWWEDNRIFDKLREKNKDGPRWSFLDGPITANNPMAVHHAWGRTLKDIFQRFHAMLGQNTRYQNGFDCQGLWVEVEVEKELGFKSKRDIEEYGIEKFIEQCKQRAFKYSKIQTEQSERLGYWMDWDNSYYTMSDENNYTIWHFLKKCYEKGWIYKGKDVMPWCFRCGTALSEHEIVTDGYREVVHRSIFLKLPLKGRENESLLIWTTTPWTLTSNVAAAVHPEMTYAKVKTNGEFFYLLESLLHILKDKYEVVETFPGEKMLGWNYKGPFDELPAQKGVEHKIIPWKEVTEKEGTGVVHSAPGCGKEDFALSKEYELAVIAPLDENGYYIEGFDWLTGRHVSEVAEDIFENLEEKGILYKLEDYAHRYPHCWRCNRELVFRLVDEWFIKMDELRYQIMDVTKKIEWMPEFGLRHELDWLKNMHDWCISKKRYWGLCLPIYECKKCGHVEVIGSKEELKECAVEGWEKFEGHSPHKPFIDKVKIRCKKCDAVVSRIPDVGNPWLDAGIVPYSTLHYLTDRDYWEKWFPADFITECFPGQFRNWFYSLLAMSTVIENAAPFRKILGHALVKDEQGNEMHKSSGNAIWFDDAAEEIGVEVMRYIFASHNPYNNLNFGYELGRETLRTLLTYWNGYSFFVTYAAIDGFDPSRVTVGAKETSLMDRWLLSKLNNLVKQCREKIDAFETFTVMRLMEKFVDELSNWYIRTNRRRFWKSENDDDKTAAYMTLYTTLTTLAKLYAPMLPFLSEEMYQNLVCSVMPDAPESVHLTEYPKYDENLVDTVLEEQMSHVINVVKLGRSARNIAQIKIRQPLSSIALGVQSDEEREAVSRFVDLIRAELNIKGMEFSDSLEEFAKYTIKPNFKLLGPKYGKAVPKIAKAIANLDDTTAAKRELDLTDQLKVEVGDAKYTLSKDELEIRTESKEGYAVEMDANNFVALDIRLTHELLLEGFARELVNKIQLMRKEADFNVADRIKLSVQSTDIVHEAFDTHRNYITGETLAIEVVEKPGANAFVKEWKVNGENAEISVEQNR